MSAHLATSTATLLELLAAATEALESTFERLQLAAAARRDLRVARLELGDATAALADEAALAAATLSATPR
jgi:hypothetical protein